MCGEKLATVDTGLDGTEAPENANLLDIADNGHNV